MAARELDFYVCSCKTLAGLVLSDYKLLKVLKTMLKFAKLLELEYGLGFPRAQSKDSRADLAFSNFSQEQFLPLLLKSIPVVAPGSNRVFHTVQGLL